jgi:hypothetical protein
MSSSHHPLPYITLTTFDEEYKEAPHFVFYPFLLQSLCIPWKIKRVTKSKRMRWTGYAADMDGMRNA